MMFFYFILSTLQLAWLVAGLALLVLSVRTLVRGIRRVPASRPRAACGACGYGVEGLTRLACPECGSSLLTVGITTRLAETRRRCRPVASVMALGYLILLIGMIVAGAVILYLVNPWGAPSGWTQTTTGTLTAPSAAPVVSSIDYTEVQDWSASAGSAGIHATYVVHGKGSREDLTIDLDSRVQSLRAVTTSGTVLADVTSFGSIEVRELLEKYGLDPSDRTSEAIILDMVNVTNLNSSGMSVAQASMAALRNTTVSTTSTPTGTTPPSTSLDEMDILLITGGVALVLWIGGSWLLLRRRTRLLREAAIEGTGRGISPATRPPTEPARFGDGPTSTDTPGASAAGAASAPPEGS